MPAKTFAYMFVIFLYAYTEVLHLWFWDKWNRNSFCKTCDKTEMP